mmetsp:Transcript_9498/g.32831  ORF Transcript_9498/g.32831 Transcript_9498/m.32831 type:complete len:251 (-) Transcript_9498:92-844(-)
MRWEAGMESLVSTAILILARASALDTTSFVRSSWPHDFGTRWSSRRIPARPAEAYPRTALLTFIASPPPLSASTISGRLGAASLIDRAESNISEYVMSWASGMPSLEADVVKPETNAARNPALSISLALRPSWQHGQGIAPPSFSAKTSRSFSAGDLSALALAETRGTLFLILWKHRRRRVGTPVECRNHLLVLVASIVKGDTWTTWDSKSRPSPHSPAILILILLRLEPQALPPQTRTLRSPCQDGGQA